MPFVVRAARASIAAPNGTRISSSAWCQSTSESTRRPSMSNTAAPESGRSGRQVLFDRLDQGGVLGGHHRAVARHDLARWADEELLEVPPDVADVAVGVGHLLQLRIDRVLALAVHFDLLEEREGDAVVGGAERRDLFG